MPAPDSYTVLHGLVVDAGVGRRRGEEEAWKPYSGASPSPSPRRRRHQKQAAVVHRSPD
jgi:hypothetical protein